MQIEWRLTLGTARAMVQERQMVQARQITRPLSHTAPSPPRQATSIAIRAGERP